MSVSLAESSILMGLEGNIGGLEWGLFAPEITHYLPSPIKKYHISQKYVSHPPHPHAHIF